ncbi:hypothetical protein D3C84_697490 [compost metagenome]
MLWPSFRTTWLQQQHQQLPRTVQQGLQTVVLFALPLIRVAAKRQLSLRQQIVIKNRAICGNAPEMHMTFGKGLRWVAGRGEKCSLCRHHASNIVRLWLGHVIEPLRQMPTGQ